jgi:hypothetical protein
MPPVLLSRPLDAAELDRVLSPNTGYIAFIIPFSRMDPDDLQRLRQRVRSAGYGSHLVCAAFRCDESATESKLPSLLLRGVRRADALRLGRDCAMVYGEPGDLVLHLPGRDPIPLGIYGTVTFADRLGVALGRAGELVGFTRGPFGFMEALAWANAPRRDTP